MSMESEVLDRLEKRNTQIARLQNTIGELTRELSEAQSNVERMRLQMSSGAVNEQVRSFMAEISGLRAEVETLKHERDSAINECERLRAESKETIGDLRAQVDARLIERLSRQQAPLQVLYKELLSMREALGSKLRASVDKTTEALRGVAANETAQTKMHEGEVPQQSGGTEEP